MCILVWQCHFRFVIGFVCVQTISLFAAEKKIVFVFHFKKKKKNRVSYFAAASSLLSSASPRYIIQWLQAFFFVPEFFYRNFKYESEKYLVHKQYIFREHFSFIEIEMTSKYLKCDALREFSSIRMNLKNLIQGWMLDLLNWEEKKTHTEPEEISHHKLAIEIAVQLQAWLLNRSRTARNMIACIRRWIVVLWE